MERLVREIRLPEAILIVINTIVGTGLFFIPLITTQFLGYSSIFAWYILGGLSFLMGMIFAELSYLIPRAGSVYDYSKEAFGESAGFLVGWTSILSYIVASSMLLSISSEYMASILGINQKLLAFILVSILSYIAYRGIKNSKYTFIFMSTITLLSIFLTIYYGTNLISKNPVWIRFDFKFPAITLLLTALYYTFEAYTGWEVVTHLSEEAKNPRKTIPYALLIGNTFVIILYLFTATLLTIIYINFGKNWFYLERFGYIVLTFIMIQILGAVFSYIVALPRLLYALSRDNLLPGIFSELHEKYKIPHYSILLSYILILFFSLTGTFKYILELVAVLLLLKYFIIVLSYVKLKLQRYRGMFPKTLSILVSWVTISMFILILSAAKPLDIIIGFMFILLGFPIYLSLTIYRRAKFTERIHDILAILWDKLSFFWIREKYLENIGFFIAPLENKKILDFGCSTGKLSIFLARQCNTCEIVASDVSRMQIAMLRRKIKKLGIKNVIPRVDPKDRISEKYKEYFDAVVSIGVLGYISDFDIFLKDLSRSLKPEGKFIFLEFDRVFRLFDMPRHLRDEEKVKELFKKYGLELYILRDKEMFWDVVYFHGYKKQI